MEVAKPALTHDKQGSPDGPLPKLNLPTNPQQPQQSITAKNGDSSKRSEALMPRDTSPVRQP